MRTWMYFRLLWLKQRAKCQFFLVFLILLILANEIIVFCILVKPIIKLAWLMAILKNNIPLLHLKEMAI